MPTVVSTYLMAQGELTFEETVHNVNGALVESDVAGQLIHETDRLGWDCLLEGRVSAQWIAYAKYWLTQTSNPMSPEGWTRRLMDRLLRITHQQWIYRNYKVHFRGRGGLTLKEHDEIFDKMGELMYTDPDELLPQHQHLLLVDKGELSEGTLSEQRVWIAKVDAARQAKEKVGRTRSNEDVQD